MRKSGLILPLFILPVLLIAACDDGPPTGGDRTNITAIPNAIGMLWKYEVYDSLTRKTDTVWVSVTDTMTVAGGELDTERRLISLRTQSVEVQYFQLRGDTLDISKNSTSAPVSERIIFPLSLDDTWQGQAGVDDTSQVSLIGTVAVPAGRFYNGARIDRSWNRDLEGGGQWSKTWIIPNVGIVSRSLLSKVSNGAHITVTRNETWSLLDYDLTTFALSKYPWSVGDTWSYQQVDSIRIGPNATRVSWDTVRVTTVETYRLSPDDRYAVQEIESKSGVDTQYIMIYDEILRIQADSLPNPLWDNYFRFPLAVGRNWGVLTSAPVPEVLDKEQILTSAGIFPSCFHTRLHGGQFDDSWMEEDWLVPDLGMVRSSRRQYGLTPQTSRTRLLIAYQLSR